MNSNRYTYPLLFIVFNKLNETKKVFDVIRLYKPKYFFIAADGARSWVEGEVENCNAVRKWVTENVDWDCEVFTLFRKENIGCGKGPSEAITWFFEHVNEGIILEDDCVPNKSFFTFCETMLEKYRNDKRVSAISGNNFLGNRTTDFEVDYFFSIFPSSWGWATWKRAWQEFDFTIESWNHINQKMLLNYIFKEQQYQLWWKKQFDFMYRQQPQDMWDFQFHYLSMKNRQLAIIPSVNLVSNIGHGEQGTHFNDPDSNIANLPTFELHFPLRHPMMFCRNYEADVHSQKLLFGQVELVSPFRKTKRFVKKLLRV